MTGEELGVATKSRQQPGELPGNGERRLLQRRALDDRVKRTAKGAAGALVFIGLWEALRASGWVDPRDLPAVPAIIGSAWTNLAGGPLWAAMGATLASWALGLLIASALGVTMGIAVGLLPRVEIATRPLLEFMRPIPSVALIPVALIVLGLGFRMEVALVAFASLWPVLFSVKAGVEGTDPRFIETGRMLGLSRAARVGRIVLPAAVPALATGVRTASSIALVLAITVEMLTGQSGMGQFLQAQRISGEVTGMWAGVLVCGLLGYALSSSFLFIEKRLLAWSPEYREN
jgi:ABC-type nitrate/sulfonate/bicarbonate transport system permease component